MKRSTKFLPVGLMAVVALVLSGCASGAMSFEDFNRSWNGISATITTYDQDGQLLDKIQGQSLQVELDKRFTVTSTTSDGEIISTPGDVLLISIGDKSISHVGSTMIWEEEGLKPIAGANGTVSITNTDEGVPWLNNLLEYNQNLWQGSAKTILIRSQNGDPIAVYAANEVEIVGTSVPKSTMFRLDGKRLFVYRADYTVYDTALLLQQ